MNKYLSLSLLVLMLSFSFFSPVKAEPTRFTSPNYGIESIIFGGTGSLRYSGADIPPVITAGPVVSAITTKTAKVSWTTDRPSNSVVRLGAESGVYDTDTGQLASTTYTNHQVELNNLTKGTKYYFRVRSGDVTGNIVESAESSFTTDPGDVTVPVIKSGPTLSFNSATAITVTWETDELSNTILEYGTRNADDNMAGRVDELAIFHQVQVAGLLPLQKYYWRIKSKDASDNLYTGEVLTFSTLSAPNITDVRITDITLNSAIVQWKSTASSTSVIHYGTSKDYGLTVKEEGYAENHLARLSNLQSGTVYYLRIFGTDQSGNALTSDEYVFKTVVLPVINGFKVSEITSFSALLTWSSSSDIDELIRYEITANADEKLVGKKLSAGNDKLVSLHSFLLSDLESGSTYRVSVVGKDVFGNQAISQSLDFITLPDSEPPAIENIRSDTSVDLGSKQTVQVLVSFGLSEMGKAFIEYGEGATGSYTEKVDTDPEYSRNKFMVIPRLRPGQSYHFRIVARDRSGNEAKSADYLVLAPSQPLSLFDLIFGQVKQNFGWLSRL